MTVLVSKQLSSMTQRFSCAGLELSYDRVDLSAKTSKLTIFIFLIIKETPQPISIIKGDYHHLKLVYTVCFSMFYYIVPSE